MQWSLLYQKLKAVVFSYKIINTFVSSSIFFTNLLAQNCQNLALFFFCSMKQLTIMPNGKLVVTADSLACAAFLSLHWQVTIRCSGWLVSKLDTGLIGLGSSPGWGHCIVFLGRTLYSQSASLHPQVYKWVMPNLMLGITLWWTSILSREE